MKNEQMALLFSEATPYIQKYHGKTLVIKYGGNAMVNDELKLAVMNDLVTLTPLGVRVVLVHGGGPAINQTYFWNTVLICRLWGGTSLILSPSKVTSPLVGVVKPPMIRSVVNLLS